MNENGFHQEISEAYRAGCQALESLRLAQDDLDSAKNWGLFDMFSRGFASTILSASMKRSRMGRAKEHMEEAKAALRRFRKELQDVARVVDLELETGDFLSFADFFCDGFFVDWMMQDRILKARDEVHRAIRMVENILDDFRNQYPLT